MNNHYTLKPDALDGFDPISVQPTKFVLGEGRICTINLDTGAVELGAGVAPEHAAHEFWKALEQLGFSHAQELTEAKSRIAELEAQVEDLGCKLREGGNI